MYNNYEIAYFILYFSKFVIIPAMFYFIAWAFAKITYKMHKMGIIK